MKILFITLSNIGDCILTLPVLDCLRQKYPDAQVTCLVPARPSNIFVNNPAVSEVIVFDKYARLTDKIKLFFFLSKEKFDLVVDLRNSFFGAFLPTKSGRRIFSPLRRIPSGIRHMRQKHLFWAKMPLNSGENKYQSLNITAKDGDYINDILSQRGLTASAKLIVIAPGSRCSVKCWGKENFNQLCAQILKEGNQIILAGDVFDQPLGDYLAQANSGAKIINLCGKTTLSQLAALLKRACLLITNDSAVMHLASYLNVPVVAIFGPTDERKYGPWSEKSAVVKKDIFCRPCEKAQCRFATVKCLTSIRLKDVLAQVRTVLGGEEKKESAAFKRILISRTDRLGDVLLSTPVIKALRQKFPQSYIAMLVSPYTQDVLAGNPALDEIIVLDKDAKNKGWLGMLKAAGDLRKNKFDLAIVLHPTTRVHLLIFLAGIPKRLGYDRKWGFLLTDRIKHTKQEGQKHESEYALDFVRYLGIEPVDKTLFMPINQASESWVEALLPQESIKPADKLLVIHPGASCHSRIWPPERFAQVADKLNQEYGLKAVIVCGSQDAQKAKAVIQNMRSSALNLAGKTSISQLASLLKRSHLFISTDSGPMHVASTLGVPVITIFGRSQAGLSPQRWGPLTEKKRILYKTVGCTICLAHNCQKDFACLKSTTVEDVLKAAGELLG